MADTDGPVLVHHTGGYGCDGGEVAAWALYTTRALAEAAIAEYDAAVRRAEADGVRGICHVGDFAIASLAEVAIDPPALMEHDDDSLYLFRYWREVDTDG